MLPSTDLVALLLNINSPHFECQSGFVYAAQSVDTEETYSVRIRQASWRGLAVGMVFAQILLPRGKGIPIKQAPSNG